MTTKIASAIATAAIVAAGVFLLVGEGDAPFDHVNVHCGNGGGPLRIDGWRGEDGETIHFFLPSHADINAITLGGDHQRYEFKYNGTPVKDGLIPSVELDSPGRIEAVEKGRSNGESWKVRFLKSKNIASLHIVTESGSMGDLESDKSLRETGKMSLVTADGYVEYDGDLKYIHGRGNSSWHRYDKKGFTFRLAQKANLLRMRAAEKWCIVANATDETYLRNKIVHDIGKSVMKGEYSPDCEFVDVYFNSEYYGNYLLMEKIEVSEERLNLRNGGSDDVTGGYVLEREYQFRLKDAKERHFITAGNDAFIIRDPDDLGDEGHEYISDYIQQVEDAIYAKDGFNALTGVFYLDYVNLDSFVKKYLIEEISKNTDGGSSSLYLYKYPDEIDPAVYAGPLWDYDHAFGWMSGLWASPRGLTHLNEKSSSLGWFEALCRKDEFEEAMVEAYAEQFLPHLNTLIDSGIDEYADEIEASVKMDRIRWSEWYEGYWTRDIDTDFRESVEKLKAYISQRTEYLTDVWIDGVDYCEIRAHGGDIKYADVYYTSSGYLETELRTPSIFGCGFEGWYHKGTDEEFDVAERITRDIEIEARYSYTVLSPIGLAIVYVWSNYTKILQNLPLYAGMAIGIIILFFLIIAALAVFLRYMVRRIIKWRRRRTARGPGSFERHVHDEPRLRE